MGFDAVALARYPQVERIEHVHTAGNSSGIVDGAAAVLIGSEAKGETLGLAPRGRIVATALSGADPTIMLTGPMPATRKALAKAGLDDRRHRPVRGQRGVRRGADALHARARRAAREGQRQRRRDRDGPPARRDRRDAARHAARRARAAQAASAAWSRCASAAAWASRRSSSASERAAPWRPCATRSMPTASDADVRRARRARQHDDRGVAARPRRRGGAARSPTRSASAASCSPRRSRRSSPAPT